MSRRIVEDTDFPIMMPDGVPLPSMVGFRYTSVANAELAFVPYWFLVCATVTLVGAPWLSFAIRFSLRTLLIATTLVAVVLGMIVYDTR